MELTEKTTILFSKPFVRQLRQVAKARHVSVGQLIRDACARQYGVGPAADAVVAAEELAALSLPVDEVAVMKAQSVPPPSELSL
jgi:hypothetical protein